MAGELGAMFKALDRISGDEIILLDQRWAEQLGCLRLQDRNDELVCQGCRFPVRVRAGKIKRWHFAHKQVRDCHYGRESPELLLARAVLYRRLKEKFGDRVTLEKQLDARHFPRPVDCWVERPEGSFAYWIFDRGARPCVWNQLRSGLASAGAFPQWVFTSGMLKEYEPGEGEVVEEGRERFHAGTTEREFMQKSFADEVPAGVRSGTGKSLHYLDPETGTLTSYRRVRLVHAPHLCEGHRYRTALSEVLVSGKTGEFGHPGERERARAVHEEQVRVAQEQKSREQREAVERQRRAEAIHQRPQTANAPVRPAAVPIVVRTVVPRAELPPKPSREEPLVYPEEREANCIFCGSLTRDWWYFDPVSRICRCNPCLKSGVY